MKKINFVMIGTGNISKTHIAAMNFVKEVNLAGVLSLTGRKRSFVDGSVKVYSSLGEVFEDKNINAVDIVAKNDLHVKLGIAAADCGKHVLVEKPIATSLSDADKLINVCVKNRVKLSVVSQSRFMPAYAGLKKNIERNRFGKIGLAVFSWIAGRNENYYDSSPWRGSKKEAGGGFLIMNAIHYIDLFQWFFGPTVSVSAEVRNFKRRGIEDAFCAMLNFKDGAMGVGYGTSAVSVSFPPGIMIYGDKGNACISHGNDDIVSPDNFAAQIRDFARAILENREPAVGGVDARNALKTILAIYRSARFKKEITIGK